MTEREMVFAGGSLLKSTITSSAALLVSQLLSPSGGDGGS